MHGGPTASSFSMTWRTRPNSRVTSRQIGPPPKHTVLGVEDPHGAALLTFRPLNRAGPLGSNPQDAEGQSLSLLTKHAVCQKSGPSDARFSSIAGPKPIWRLVTRLLVLGPLRGLAIGLMSFAAPRNFLSGHCDGQLRRLSPFAGEIKRLTPAASSGLMPQRSQTARARISRT